MYLISNRYGIWPTAHISRFMRRQETGGDRMDNLCSTCAYLVYDEDDEEYVCDCEMDEDEYYHVLTGGYKKCPFYRNGDEYKVVRKQM